jgi:glycosyltransferase 2 family protein
VCPRLKEVTDDLVELPADRNAEAALIAGLAALGVPAAVGVPSVLLYRVLTCWIPVVIGWPMMRWLTNNEMV